MGKNCSLSVMEVPKINLQAGGMPTLDAKLNASSKRKSALERTIPRAWPWNAILHTLFNAQGNRQQTVSHMGSCVGSKCANVTSDALVTELQLGNNFTGRTGCLKSCGDSGCDCFYLRSGCLFYRVYEVQQAIKYAKFSDAPAGKKV